MILHRIPFISNHWDITQTCISQLKFVENNFSVLQRGFLQAIRTIMINLGQKLASKGTGSLSALGDMTVDLFIFFTLLFQLLRMKTESMWSILRMTPFTEEEGMKLFSSSHEKVLKSFGNSLLTGTKILML